ncbi:MAG: hypothetical protein VB118_07210, partial [Oscillospiraceae bacterium]|nr:hypothetical protein [Oscillospiraceae bacterium]
FYYVYISNGDIEQFALCHDKIKICGERSYGDIINETYYLSEKYVYNSTLNVYESIPFTKSLSSSKRNDIIEKATTSLKSLIANIDKKNMYEIVHNNGVPFYTNDGDYFVDLSKQNNNLTVYPSTEYTSIDPYTLGTFVLSFDLVKGTNEINSYKVYYYYSEEYDSNETEYPGWGEIKMLDIYNS